MDERFARNPGALCVSLLCGRPVEPGMLWCLDLSDMDFRGVQL